MVIKMEDLLEFPLHFLSLISSVLLIMSMLSLWMICTPRRYAPGPIIFPIVGSPQSWVGSFLFGNSMTNALRNRAKYGGVFQMMLPSFKPAIMFSVSDPKVIRAILGNSIGFPERPKGIFEMVAPFGLLALPTAEKWALHRSALNPILVRADLLRNVVESVNLVSKRLIKKMKAKTSNEMNSLFVAATFDTIIEAGFGFQPNTLENPNSKLSVALSLVLKQASSFQVFPKFLLYVSGSLKRFNSTLQQLRNFADDAKRISCGISGRYNVVRAIESRIDEHELSDSEIIDETLTLMIAGHETTAHTLSWTLRLLAENPKCQKKAYEEVLKVLGDHEEVSYELIQNSSFPYLRAVIMESLRIFPTVPIFSRNCAKDTVIGSHFFPAGSIIGIPVISCNLNAEYWDEPFIFSPERFLGLSFLEEGKLRTQKGFYPFGGGKRMCLGNRFALVEMMVLLASLLRKFRFKPTKGAARSKGKCFLTLFPEKGVHLDCVAHNEIEPNV